MTNPSQIRDFFNKIEKVSAIPVASPVPQAAQQAAVTPEVSTGRTETVAPKQTVIPSFEPTKIPVFSAYTDDCPPMTYGKSQASRAMFDDFGVGLPPLAESNR